MMMAESCECACCIGLESWLENFVDHRKHQGTLAYRAYQQAEADMARRVIAVIRDLHKAASIYSGPASIARQENTIRRLEKQG